MNTNRQGNQEKTVVSQGECYIQIALNNGMVHYLQAVVNDKVATYNAESVEKFFEAYK